MSARKNLGGDPVEVQPSDSHAESQLALNGPSGSPTSPPEPDRLRQVLKQIAEPSYVGNYSPEEVVQIYRKWASNALAAARGGDAQDTSVREQSTQQEGTTA